MVNIRTYRQSWFLNVPHYNTDFLRNAFSGKKPNFVSDKAKSDPRSFRKMCPYSGPVRHKQVAPEACWYDTPKQILILSQMEKAHKLFDNHSC